MSETPATRMLTSRARTCGACEATDDVIEQWTMTTLLAQRGIDPGVTDLMGLPGLRALSR